LAGRSGSKTIGGCRRKKARIKKNLAGGGWKRKRVPLQSEGSTKNVRERWLIDAWVEGWRKSTQIYPEQGFGLLVLPCCLLQWSFHYVAFDLPPSRSSVPWPKHASGELGCWVGLGWVVCWGLGREVSDSAALRRVAFFLVRGWERCTAGSWFKIWSWDCCLCLWTVKFRFWLN